MSKSHNLSANESQLAQWFLNCKIKHICLLNKHKASKPLICQETYHTCNDRIDVHLTQTIQIQGGSEFKKKRKNVKKYSKTSEQKSVVNFELWKVNFEQVKFWTLIHLINNFVIALVCAKCSKLIILEKNIRSVQQIPLYLWLFFVFSSEVLNSVINSHFDGIVLQDAVCEECFRVRLRYIHL